MTNPQAADTITQGRTRERPPARESVMVLEGLKVVELATWVAAPGCAMILGEWGAEVIKVESFTGDPTRAYYPDTAESPANPAFSMENRGKRAVVLDIGKPEGREALLAILKDTDVFVTNLRPGPLARARLDYETLKARFPRLIFASVSGYGLQGDEADRPAFDMTGFWTRTGIAASTIPPDREPFFCRPGFGDHVTALATLSGLLAALHQRNRTGQGQLVEASLMRAGVYALSWDLSVQLRYGEVITAQPRHERLAPTAGFFRTGDGRWLSILPRSPTCFPALMGVVGRPDLADEPRFAPPVEDLAAANELRAVIDAGFCGMTLAEAGERLTRADLAWAPMATPAEVAADPQAHVAGCFLEVPDGWGGAILQPASPVRVPGAGEWAGRAAPKLGEHTREVLLEAGYAPEAVEALLASRIVGQDVVAPQ
jgi:crotonobetainyl-CoA:carnitine CoA-transferase CaiB-like acyl-CoA transferase